MQKLHTISVNTCHFTGPLTITSTPVHVRCNVRPTLPHRTIVNSRQTIVSRPIIRNSIGCFVDTHLRISQQLQWVVRSIQEQRVNVRID
nr:MAG TPA: hypothetical protein [Caudoviricetes sp.]